MIDDYINKLYIKESQRHKLLVADNYAKAKELAAWKEDMASKWDSFTVDSITVTDKESGKTLLTPNQPFSISKGDNIVIDIVIDKKDISGDLGVDCVVVEYDSDKKSDKFIDSFAFQRVKAEGSKQYFRLDNITKNSGTYKCGFRVYPDNADLPHRMDFAYVRWI